MNWNRRKKGFGTERGQGGTVFVGWGGRGFLLGRVFISLAPVPLKALNLWKSR